MNSKEIKEIKNDIVTNANKVNTISVSPAMGEEKALTAASYILRLKRDRYEKKATEAQIKNLIENYLVVANCFVISENCSELENIIEEIKADCKNINDDIKLNKINTVSQVNSRLDVTTMEAIYVDIIYDEIVLTYNFLTKQKHYKLSKNEIELCLAEFNKAKQKKEELNLIIANEINSPINKLKSSKVKGRTR